MLGCVPESVEKAFYAVWRLIFEDFDAAFHVDFGRLGERSYGMDVVVQDDHPDHHPEAEGHRVLACEAAAILRCFQHDFAHARHRA